MHGHKVHALEGPNLFIIRGASHLLSGYLNYPSHLWSLAPRDLLVMTITGDVPELLAVVTLRVASSLLLLCGAYVHQCAGTRLSPCG